MGGGGYEKATQSWDLSHHAQVKVKEISAFDDHTFVRQIAQVFAPPRDDLFAVRGSRQTQFLPYYVRIDTSFALSRACVGVKPSRTDRAWFVHTDRPPSPGDGPIHEGKKRPLRLIVENLLVAVQYARSNRRQ
jgi:hypothetical protein